MDDIDYLGADGSPLSYNLFAYCMNNPSNYYDPTGEFFLSATFGGIAAWKIVVTLLGAIALYVVTDALVKNPPSFPSIYFPEIEIGIESVIGNTIVPDDSVIYSKSKTDSDPYARPNQKKQGRERKNKAREKDDWKPRSVPRPPKKHTPGRDHRRFK